MRITEKTRPLFLFLLLVLSGQAMGRTGGGGNSVSDGHARSRSRSSSPSSPSSRRLPPSDALLTDWEGQHWASLDPDQDKVALSWTADQESITFQVGCRNNKFKFKKTLEQFDSTLN